MLITGTTSRHGNVVYCYGNTVDDVGVDGKTFHQLMIILVCNYHQ